MSAEDLVKVEKPLKRAKKDKRKGAAVVDLVAPSGEEETAKTPKKESKKKRKREISDNNDAESEIANKEVSIEPVAADDEEEEEEIIVESRKDARKRKKRELKAMQNGSSANDEETKKVLKSAKKSSTKKAGGSEKPPKPEKGLNGVWVGNMSYFTTKDALRAHFAECGAITRLHLPKANKTKSVGYAYIDFATPEAQSQALQLNESYLDRRALLIKPASDHTVAETAKTPRPESQLNSNPRVVAQSHRPTPTLFVGNLGFETTRQCLQTLFGKYGKIMKVRLSQWEDSGRCKGYGWIDFADLESAKSAIADSPRLVLEGRRLKCEFGSRESHERARPWEYRDNHNQQ